MVSEDHLMYVESLIRGIIFLTLYANYILMAGTSWELIKVT